MKWAEEQVNVLILNLEENTATYQKYVETWLVLMLVWDVLLSHTRCRTRPIFIQTHPGFWAGNVRMMNLRLH